MIQGAFQHRSGRVISLARVAIAAVFLTAIWADPSQPSRYPLGTYVVLGGYLAVSAAYLAATWTDWWLERRLGGIAHGVDIALFGVVVYLTDGYTSPFYTFFLFLILSATIRSSWKATAATAAVVVLLFLFTGLAATPWSDVDQEITRIIARSTYLVILSLLLIWFSLNQHSGLAQFDGDSSDDGTVTPATDPPIRRGLQQGVVRTGARQAALVWWDQDEPWVNLASLAGGSFSEQRLSPDAFGTMVDPRLLGRTFLFDAANARVLVAVDAEEDAEAEAITGIAEPLHPALLARIGAAEGLAVPVATETHGALFLLCGVPGLCADDLRIGKRLGEQFSKALRQSSMLGMFEKAAANRTRMAIARDLHDTVVQLLAGTSLRLQGIRRAITAGRDVDADLKDLQDALAGEQQGIRKMIGELRSDAAGGEVMQLAEGLLIATRQAGRQWGVRTEIEDYPGDARVGKRLGHEINQLVREAVANAARHGQASEVVLVAAKADRALTLAIRDNGIGFADAGCGITVPRSLQERVHALGGTLKVESASTGSTVTIRLPWEWKR
jgi:signal transduction histidine kinase